MFKKFRPWAIGVALLLMIGASVYYGPLLWTLVQDREALQAWVAELGWYGPIVLIVANALQIIVAPIPGYVFQLAAGFLYGPLWGGIWGSIGLMTGAGIAMWLARVYGRPLVTRLVGAQRLAKWESVTHSTNIAVWFVLLLGPTGDIPYLLAGLSKVSFFKVMAITAILRIPSIFVVAGAGAGVMYLNWWQLAIIVGVLTAFVIVFMRYQDQILARLDGLTYRQVVAKMGTERKMSPPLDPKLTRDEIS
ncbi:MAG: VTT domain-containing protein [Litorilinea sp.]